MQLFFLVQLLFAATLFLLPGNHNMVVQHSNSFGCLSVFMSDHILTVLTMTLSREKGALSYR